MPSLITYWPLESIDLTFPWWPELRMEDCCLARTLQLSTRPPAELHQLETQPLPEHHAVTVDWISLKGNNLAKSVLTPPCPPARLGQPVPLVPCQGYNWHRRQQVPLNVSQATISPKVGFWLIEPEDWRPSHWQILSTGAMFEQRALHLAPGDSFYVVEQSREVPRSYADQMQNTWTLPVHRKMSPSWSISLSVSATPFHGFHLNSISLERIPIGWSLPIHSIKCYFLCSVRISEKWNRLQPW